MSGQRPQRASQSERAELLRPGSLDTSTAHAARRYNYLLGGKDNYAADRASAQRIAEVFPSIATGVAENRAFLRRAVSYLSAHGIRQFLDIGAGLPTDDNSNTHQVAQRIAAESRIVYVDNDPVVLAHARALLTGSRRGTVAHLDADLREPDTILDSPLLRDTLDLTQPVGLLLLAVLHFVSDSDDPYDIVARLVAAMPPGSYLVISHATNEYLTPQAARVCEAAANAGSHTPFRLRSRSEIGRFLAGLERVEPGLVSVGGWRAAYELQPRPSPAETAVLGAVTRIPRYGGVRPHNDAGSVGAPC